jgi:phosphohistidine phosphatase
VNDDLACPRRLVLLRHAKAEPAGELDDLLRPLALVGRRQAGAVGASLRDAGVVPELVLCSSAVRTRQTWDLAHAVLGGESRLEVSDALYDAGVRSLLGMVRAVPADVRTVLVVGHEPTVSRFATTLAGPTSDARTLARVQLGMATGSYSFLEIDVEWSQLEPDGGRLTQLVTPG